jgi:hypothetical protein
MGRSMMREYWEQHTNSCNWSNSPVQGFFNSYQQQYVKVGLQLSKPSDLSISWSILNSAPTTTPLIFCVHICMVISFSFPYLPAVPWQTGSADPIWHVIGIMFTFGYANDYYCHLRELAPSSCFQPPQRPVHYGSDLVNATSNACTALSTSHFNLPAAFAFHPAPLAHLFFRLFRSLHSSLTAMGAALAWTPARPRARLLL